MIQNIKKIHIGGGTARLVKRVTSIVLSLMLVASLFSINFSASATEVETATESTTAETTVADNKTEEKAAKAETSQPDKTEKSDESEETKAVEKKVEKTKKTPVKKKTTKVNTGAKAKVKTGDASGSCGSNATWSFEEATGTLTISGSGNMNNYTKTTSAPYYSPYGTAICSIIIEDGITSIGNYAFDTFTNLTYVYISNSVTSIGDYAFRKCTKLNTKPTIPSNCTVSSSAFSGCGFGTCGDNANWSFDITTGILTISGTGPMQNSSSPSFKSFKSKIKSIIIENGITTIGDSVFSGCTALTNVTIPDSITSIGTTSFQGCSALTSVTIPNSLTSFGRNAFQSCNISSVYISDLNTWCNLTFTTFPFTYGYDLYLNNEKVSNLIIPNTITSINNYTFYNCKSITNIIIPNNITSLGDYAFGYCNIQSLPTIPSSCTVTSKTFYGCYVGFCGENITYEYNSTNHTLTLSGTGNMDNFTQSGGIISRPWASFYQYIEKVIIDEGITSIGNYSFSSCTSLTDITISNSVISIGDYAFNACSSLTSMPTIPNGCTVASTAFNSCGFGSGSCGENVEWNLESGILIISGTGAMNNYSSSSKAPWYSSRTTINTININENITTIGNYAFNGCNSLTNLTFPNTLTSIGNYAFNGCNSLANLTFPNTLTSIGDYAFKDCYNIKSEPNTPVNCNVSSTAFDGCGFGSGSCGDNVTWNLENGTLTLSGTGSMTDYTRGTIPWTKSAITNIIINDGITTIGNYAFYQCSALENITIPNGVTSIGTCAFSGCSHLSSIILPNTITSLGQLSFENCSSLENISFPSSMTAIDKQGVFENCTSLTSITIPDNITYIATLVFYECSNLSTININNPQSCTVEDADVFYGCKCGFGQLNDNIYWKLSDGVLNVDGTGDMDVEVGDSTFPSVNSSPEPTELGNNVAWSNLRSSITSVVIGNSITSIAPWAFGNCSNIKSVTLGLNIKTIHWGAFYGCTDAIVIVPESVNSIGKGAFYYCDKVICPVDSIPYNRLTGDTFTNYRDSSVEIIGIVSDNNELNSVFGSNNNKNPISTGMSKIKKSSGAIMKNNKTGIREEEFETEELTKEEIEENISNIRCYLVEDIEIDNSISINSTDRVILHLNDFTINSRGELVNGTPHILEGSTNNSLIEVPGNLTIKTTGEGQGGIINSNGELFDIKSSGSLTIENGVYSEDVSEYIADNKVIGKTGNRYTVFNNKTEDLTPENDNHTFTLDNSIEAFARQQLLGVQIRPETETVSQAMRFVSVVRSDLLRGAKDYGFVLAKGQNVENMRTNKGNILADSSKCLKISAKNTSNSLADTAYSSSNLNEGSYKYLTAAITDITDDDIAIGARLYIERQDGTYVYADYTCVSTMGEVKAMAA